MKINIKKNESAIIVGSNTNSGYMIGLQWDDGGAKSADLDLEVFLLGEDGKVTCEDDIVFYGTNKADDGMHHHPSGAVVYHGDHRTGLSDGDDEQVDIYFGKLPSNIRKLAITVTLYENGEKRTTFGSVQNTVIHINNMKLVNGKPTMGDELIRYELNEDFSRENAIIFGEIIRAASGEWKFTAIGMGIGGGLAAMCRYYGFDNVDE